MLLLEFSIFKGVFILGYFYEGKIHNIFWEKQEW